MGIIDTGLEIGASFDWISPLASIIQSALNGPSHCFLIPIGSSSMTGREIGRMLKAKGIHCWGLMIVDGTLMVNVRKPDAQKAQAVLQSAGVPIDNPIAGQKKEAPKRKAANSSSPFSIFDQVFK